MAMEICKSIASTQSRVTEFFCSDAQGLARIAEENEGQQDININEGAPTRYISSHLVLFIPFRASVSDAR